MIVPMKKVSILILDKDKDASLQKIRDLGVMHLVTKNVSSPALNKALVRHSQIETATGILDAFTPKKKERKTEIPAFEGDLTSRVVSISERRKVLQDYIFSHQREKSRFSKWGNFNPKDFAYLKENGVNIYLYELQFDKYENLTKDVPYIILATDRKNNLVRIVTFDKIPNMYPYPLPDRPLSVVDERDLVRKAEMSKIEEELISLSALKKTLKADMKASLAEIEFQTARAGMEQIVEGATAAGSSISWISGYVPAPDLGALKRAASENNWALCADDPKEEDEVPTKLQNNKAVQLIYPLTGFLELIPGYRERDISVWFLVFFTLFFGMIFGDAAYGAILMLIAIIAIAKTAKKGVPLFLKFMLLMSVSNFLWGVLVCSWFCFDIALVPQFLQNISLPLISGVSENPAWIATYNANNFWIQSGLVSGYNSIETMSAAGDTNMMLFCFSIALVQLSIAHIVNIASIRSLKIIGEIGKMGILVGIYFVILSLIVYSAGFGGVEMWQWGMVGAGFFLFFVFGNYNGSLLKSILSSCTNIIAVILTITNVFSDIMSYIRLWAVGLAGASIAGIINQFAGPMFGRLVFFIFGLGLFIFGHGFNMVLNVLSVMVHGVRLNTLEFSSHIGLEWSGFAYKPFTKR